MNIKIQETIPALGTWVERNESIFFISKKKDGWIIRQYSPDGWKSLITPEFPNGKSFKHIGEFSTWEMALKYLKKEVTSEGIEII